MRRRRAAALATLALLAFGAALLPVAETFVDRQADIAAAETRLANLRARRLDPQDAEARRIALAAPPDPQAGLLAAASDPEAVARLEAIIRAAVETHGAELQTVTLSHGAGEEGVRVVRANLRLTIEEESLAALVRALETGPPVLFFERLQVSRRSTGTEDGPAGLDVAGSVAVYRDGPTSGRSGS